MSCELSQERDVGITEYMTADLPAFTAILKHRCRYLCPYSRLPALPANDFHCPALLCPHDPRSLLLTHQRHSPAASSMGEGGRPGVGSQCEANSSMQAEHSKPVSLHYTPCLQETSHNTSVVLGPNQDASAQRPRNPGNHTFVKSLPPSCCWAVGPARMRGQEGCGEQQWAEWGVEPLLHHLMTLCWPGGCADQPGPAPADEVIQSASRSFAALAGAENGKRLTALLHWVKTKHGPKAPQQEPQSVEADPSPQPDPVSSTGNARAAQPSSGPNAPASSLGKRPANILAGPAPPTQPLVALVGQQPAGCDTPQGSGSPWTGVVMDKHGVVYVDLEPLPDRETRTVSYLHDLHACLHHHSACRKALLMCVVPLSAVASADGAAAASLQAAGDTSGTPAAVTAAVADQDAATPAAPSTTVGHTYVCITPAKHSSMTCIDSVCTAAILPVYLSATLTTCSPALLLVCRTSPLPACLPVMLKVALGSLAQGLYLPRWASPWGYAGSKDKRGVTQQQGATAACPRVLTSRRPGEAGCVGGCRLSRHGGVWSVKIAQINSTLALNLEPSLQSNTHCGPLQNGVLSVWSSLI
ncbi:hypothetical protein HaLaN_12621 [Haematococcus lacustris]|uniref:Uncharacterized protein n=1 Tax=Haematococcus lacustris TaxID=44745 RepID=A0A699ZAG0_HAELA|nr:hypothetical protein HaLaN_12621 [Haematococcus lacustris]